MIDITSKDNVFLKVYAEPSIEMELQDFFTFEVPNARFTPSYRNKMWDGKIRLYNLHSKQIYAGLQDYIIKFAEERDYKVNIEKQLVDKSTPISKDDVRKYIEDLKPTSRGKKLIPHEHQVDGVFHAINKKRCLLVSPTASGKSLVIYTLCKYFLDLLSPAEKILIIVPTISLVSQMKSDFEDYSSKTDWDAEENVHTIFQGQDKETDKRIVISTWQSIHKMPISYFDQFKAVVGDECHLFKAQSLTNIMSKLIDCPYRVGLTGTLDGSKTHKLVIEGLFGPLRKVTTTKDLMDKDLLSPLNIDCVLLTYPESIRSECKKFTYQQEIDFLINNSERNEFICNLAKTTKGNTLVLFQLVEKHGKPLYDKIKSIVEGGRKVFFVSGNTDAEVREDIRQITENESDAIIVASYGTFSTGINITSLKNIIFSSPSKSRIRVLQSIGRQLRKSKNKDMAKLYDIGDDLHWKSRKNYTLKHLVERVKMYNEEKFEYNMVRISLGKD